MIEISAQKSMEAKFKRRLAAGFLSLLGLVTVAETPVGKSALRKMSGQSEIPAFDSNYIVQQGDRPYDIAKQSGVQGSEAIDKFDKKILEEAKDQGSSQLQPGMQIKVPSEFIEAQQEQANK